MIDIVLHNRIHARYGEAFFQRVANAAAPYLKIPKGHTAEVGISLIGPTAMRALNKKHRGKNKSTDVLSFALSTPSIKGYTHLSLGDLFISPLDVAANAAWNRLSVREQMAWTVVHGLLHLAGYDHDKSSAAAHAMFTRERTILKKLHVPIPHHLGH